MVVSSVFAVFGFFMAHLCLGLLVDFYQWGRIDHIGTAPAFIFSLFVFSLASMPFANMYSRHREFAADAYAVARTGSPWVDTARCTPTSAKAAHPTGSRNNFV